MGEAIPYSRDVVDARFEALRHGVRADIAELRTELKSDIGAVRLELGDLKSKVAELGAQMKMWALGMGLVTPLLTVILTKLWR